MFYAARKLGVRINLIMFFFSLIATALLSPVIAVTLTFVPRPIPTKSARESVQKRYILSSTPPAKGACACVRAIKLAKSPLQPGSLAMLNAANKHTRSMAVKGRLYQPPLRTMNSREALPCGTFLSGASVGRARGTNVGTTCSRLWRSRKGARSLHVVIGSHRSSDGVVWCVALFGARTKLSKSGACSRVSCHNNVT